MYTALSFSDIYSYFCYLQKELLIPKLVFYALHYLDLLPTQLYFLIFFFIDIPFLSTRTTHCPERRNADSNLFYQNSFSIAYNEFVFFFFLYHIFLLRSISSTVNQSWVHWHYDLFFLTISLYCYLCYYFTAITSDSTISSFDLCNSFCTQQPNWYFKMQIISGLNSAENSTVLLYLEEKTKASNITLYLPTLPLFYVPVLCILLRTECTRVFLKRCTKVLTAILSITSSLWGFIWPYLFLKLENLRDNFISFFITPIRNNQSPITGSFTLEIPLIWCIFTLI